MGSDLFMAEQQFRPRPNRAAWEFVNDKLELVIYKDVFYHGWQMVWHGIPNEHNKDLIKVFVKDIPEKPEVISKREKIADIVYESGIEREDVQAVVDEIWAVLEADEPDLPRIEVAK